MHVARPLKICISREAPSERCWPSLQTRGDVFHPPHSSGVFPRGPNVGAGEQKALAGGTSWGAGSGRGGRGIHPMNQKDDKEKKQETWKCFSAWTGDPGSCFPLASRGSHCSLPKFLPTCPLVLRARDLRFRSPEGDFTRGKLRI